MFTIFEDNSYHIIYNVGFRVGSTCEFLASTLSSPESSGTLPVYAEMEAQREALHGSEEEAIYTTLLSRREKRNRNLRSRVLYFIDDNANEDF